MSPQSRSKCHCAPEYCARSYWCGPCWLSFDPLSALYQSHSRSLSCGFWSSIATYVGLSFGFWLANDERWSECFGLAWIQDRNHPEDLPNTRRRCHCHPFRAARWFSGGSSPAGSASRSKAPDPTHSATVPISSTYPCSNPTSCLTTIFANYLKLISETFLYSDYYTGRGLNWVCTSCLSFLLQSRPLGRSLGRL